MFSLIEKLKEILVDKSIIDSKTFDDIFKECEGQEDLFLNQLVNKDLIGESELTGIFVESLGENPIDISSFKVSPEVLEIIPKDIVTTYQVFPLACIGHVLVLAMVNPSDIVSIDNINALTGLRVHPVLVEEKNIEKAFGSHYEEDANATFEQIIQDISDSDEIELIKDPERAGEKDRVENLIQDAPTIRLTDAIIKQAIIAKASDIFIEPLEKALRIRYRIDGMIREVDRMSKNLHFPIISRIKIMSNLDISEHRLPQDGRFKAVADRKREVDFRVSVLPTAFGEKVVLRVLDKNAAMLDITKLGFKPTALETLKKCSLKPHGMILSCGPTGSGKTTTLYSILKFIDSPEKNIITVEDPVEYQMKGINQVNVRPQVNLTFASTLRSILRQDPDVIMVGEIRDSETLDVAIKAALTGHLVLSSLHTTTAAGSIVRMMNMGIEPFLICSSVLAVVAQRLLRKLCDKCKEPHNLPGYIVDKTGLKKLKLEKPPTFFKAKGCKHCFDSGYVGRVGITEIMVLSPTVKKLILDKAGEIRIKEASRKEKMVTMREDALEKAACGLTSIEEVFRVTASDEVI